MSAGRPSLRVTVLALLLAACHRSADGPRISARPQVTRVAQVVETLHGVQVIDNYRWLEEDGPDVARWTEAENRYTRDVLDQLPGRAALEARLHALSKVGSITAPVVRGNRYFYASRAAGDDRTVVSWREGAFGADRPALDSADIDPSGTADVAWFSPSPDGRSPTVWCAPADGRRCCARSTSTPASRWSRRFQMRQREFNGCRTRPGSCTNA